MTAGPLEGRRVVVTRAADQSESLARKLREAGAEPLFVPLIEIAEPADGGAALASALSRLDDHDWLIVTSPNGASRVAAAVGAEADGASIKIAVVGSATEAALKRPADLVPGRQSVRGLLAEFPAGSGRALVAQAEQAGPELVDGLRAKGWTVTAVTAYRTVAVHPSAGVLLAVLAADAVLFASGSAVLAWVAGFGLQTPAVCIAIGPSTAAVAGKIGLKIDAVAADHSLDGMVSALLMYLSGTE